MGSGFPRFGGCRFGEVLVNVVIDDIAGYYEIETRHMYKCRCVCIAVAYFNETKLLAFELKDAIVNRFGKTLRPFDLIGEVSLPERIGGLRLQVCHDSLCGDRSRLGKPA